MFKTYNFNYTEFSINIQNIAYELSVMKKKVKDSEINEKLLKIIKEYQPQAKIKKTHIHKYVNIDGEKLCRLC